MKARNSLVSLSCIFLLIASNLPADSRKGNIELFVLLDKSLSMVEEIEDVTAYVSRELLGDMLIPGDMVVLINFYGKTDLFYENHNISRDEIKDLMDVVRDIRADGRFTDIGSALDRLIRESSRINPEEERKRYLLLLTDGKQEAPPESMYYAPDGTFNHAMLEHTRVIAKKGWKIHILGIGADTAAEELARELSAGYSQVREGDETPVGDASDNTASGQENSYRSMEEGSTIGEEISQALEGFAEWTEAAIRRERLLLERNGTLILPLRFQRSSRGGLAEKKKIITVSEIRYTPEGGAPFRLAGELKIVLTEAAGKGQNLDMELQVDRELHPTLIGAGEVRFIFRGEETFQPVVFPVQVELQNPWYIRFWPVYPVLLVLLILGLRLILVAAGKSKDDDDKRDKKPLE